MTAEVLARREHGYFSWLAVARGPDRLIASTTDGELVVSSLDMYGSRAIGAGVPAIHQLAVHGARVAVTGPGAVRVCGLGRDAIDRTVWTDAATRFEAIAWTPDGRHVVVAGGERISVLAIDREQVVDEWRGGERTPGIAVHGSGAIAHLACFQGGSELVIDTLTDQARRAGRRRQLAIGADVCTPGGFSPDGSALAFAARHVQIHRTADLSLVHAFDYWGDRVDAPAGAVEAPWSNAVFTPDGRHLVCGSPLGTILVWNLAAGRADAVHAAHDAGVIALALDPSGRRIFSSGYDRTLRTCPLA